MNGETFRCDAWNDETYDNYYVFLRGIKLKPSFHDALAYYGIDSAHPGGFDLSKKLLTKEKFNEQMHVLDAGCGTGQTSAFLAQSFNCRVTALDNHPEILKKAGERFEKESLPIQLVEGSIEQLPFKNETFDFIISESATTFTQISLSLSEYFRVLKPNGSLLALEMNAETPLQAEELANIRRVYGIYDVLTEEQWIEAFKTARFTETEIVTGSSVFLELERAARKSEKDNEKRQRVFTTNSLYMEIIREHEYLTSVYAPKLGYRVFPAIR